MHLASSEIQGAAKTRINSFKDKSLLQALARRNEIRRDLLSLIEIAFDADKSDASFWRSTIRDALEIDYKACNKTINYFTRVPYPTRKQSMSDEEAHLLIDVLYSVCESIAEGSGPSTIVIFRYWSITTMTLAINF